MGAGATERRRHSSADLNSDGNGATTDRIHLAAMPCIMHLYFHVVCLFCSTATWLGGIIEWTFQEEKLFIILLLE
jgi:hypothetical protein